MIEIPEDTYKDIIESRFIERGFIWDEDKEVVIQAVKNGTPLPKGHGKIGDLDELYSIFKNDCDAYNIDNLSFISDMNMHFDLAPTIIEADKGE